LKELYPLIILGVTTPTTKSFGPSFARFKSPQNVETNKIINEDLPVAEQKSEASAEKDRSNGIFY